MSNVPKAAMLEELAIDPAPVRASPALLIVVIPVYVFMPLSMLVPAITLKPPAPVITPPKVLTALVRVRVLPPKVTVPLPERSVTDAPEVVWLMSNVPEAAMLEELAIDPPAESASVALELIVVVPVYVFIPAVVNVPEPTLKLPAPAITPEKELTAFDRVSALFTFTVPLPERSLIITPEDTVVLITAPVTSCISDDEADELS
jgi:hypothetical protein